MSDHFVPLDVPEVSQEKYAENYREITRGSGRLMLSAGDQKAEHLNDDFYGPGIDSQDADPEHLFRIAAQARVGVFTTQLGMIARYGPDYRSVPYLVKLNSKTNLIKTSRAEPRSIQWLDLQHMVDFHEESGLEILGVGYTIYLGSEHEAEMLREAARLVFQAHQYGLVTVLWMYPRGKGVRSELDPHLIAGAVGLATTLGSDFVKVNYPGSAEAFREAVAAAGRTGWCVWEESMNARSFLKQLFDQIRMYDQIRIGGAAANATGRNIHQRPLDEVVRQCNAVYALTVEDASIGEAAKIYAGD